MRSLRRHGARIRALPPPARLLSTAPETTTAAAASTSPAITSLLIANRGEISLRIHRTATRLGIPTTTLYTPIDAASQHARCSPSSLAVPSYLDADRIVALARQHSISALHPGYGFLSENPTFASACERAGIAFVGPPASAMHDMGDKARSKEIMNAAGVACVPGYHGPQQAVEELAGHADKIGYPVLLKSVKGGGGKGMRIVKTAQEFTSQLRSARAEAKASFGEGGEVMLVEKYIERPRHVEVQVFADKHGACVALGERDCSVQRRHQKILEESPAPGLDSALRHDLWDKARTAALAVGYVGAGTVEFILDVDTDKFYFMEMNTRLQVEHPVSEMVTGTDLVEWQLRIAAGAKLPLTQEEIEARIEERGAAIEARIYAEKPERGFMPDSGKLLHLSTPKTGDDVRIDAGFVQGDVVSEAYDGMIAKLIVRGDTREEAIRSLDLALQSYEVVGLSTNIEFLKRLCRSPAFIAGDVETGFIDKWRDELFQTHRIENEVFVQAALGLLTSSQPQQTSSPSETRASPHNGAIGFGDTATVGERSYAFSVRDDYGEKVDGEVIQVALTPTGDGRYNARVVRKGEDTPQEFDRIVCEARSETDSTTAVTSFFPLSRIESRIVREGEGPEAGDAITVFQLGRRTELSLERPKWVGEVLGTKDAASSVNAPMPCKILRNEVEEGQAVEKGDALVVIESMKMETVTRSPQKGVIKKLAHKEGDICKAGTVLVLFEEEPSAEESTS